MRKLEEGKTDLQIINDLNIDRRKYNRILKKLRETQPKKPFRMVSGWAGQPVG